MQAMKLEIVQLKESLTSLTTEVGKSYASRVAKNATSCGSRSRSIRVSKETRGVKGLLRPSRSPPLVLKIAVQIPRGQAPLLLQARGLLTLLLEVRVRSKWREPVEFGVF